MLLSKLLDRDLSVDVEVTGICLDSRAVRYGDLFVAVAGKQSDGRLFMDEAVKQGAVAIIYEENNVSSPPDGIISLTVNSLKNDLPRLAQKFFDYRQDNLQLVGITGTNGKTSIAIILKQLLCFAGYSTGYIGTLGHGSTQPRTNANAPLLTTPDIFTLYSCLNRFAQDNHRFAVIEASSHALDQNRIAGLNFEYGVFSNLSRDHFDYHHNFDDYFATKKKLFDYVNKAVVNIDDPYGIELVRHLSSTFCYSITKKIAPHGAAIVYADNCHIGLTKSRFNLCFNGQSVECCCPITGSFAISNILAACCILIDMGCSLEMLAKALESVRAPRGRMELVAHNPNVFIDYAHTPDALEKSLAELRHLTEGRMLVVFGCGGERDKGKRHLMGKCAGQLADRIFVTSDNPRDEDPMQIIDQIVQGITKQNANKLIVEPERESAIAMALAEARYNDCVLIAGKGHETGQIIKGQAHHYSDHETVVKFMRKS